MTETTRHSSPLRPGLAPLVAPTVGEANPLYQLEYTDTSGAGDLVIQSGYSAADAAVYLRSLLALGVSPVTVRVIA
ncbi:hypothetical protein PMI15_03033 [Polaromonas sp. CF318]|uniref:hypothetical protein n=1 Tax=Polaromonas sp. CF318 TaxID=1144318 RepID=UPI000270E333|nr:hypothetical protein [Polaromonas sp. CF318]EJL82430.1 hypothetical protein PMI15_03033 [Polaromonas sp. CF318]